MIQHALLIFFCLAIAVKGDLFSPKRFALFGTLAICGHDRTGVWRGLARVAGGRSRVSGWSPRS